jgi:oligoendopeptidase F
MAKKIDVNKNNKEMLWNLKDILRTEKDFEKLYRLLERDLKKYQTIRKNLKPTISTKEFKKIVEFNEKYKERLARLGSYSSLLISANVKDQKARLMESKLDNLSIKLGDITLFWSHWIKGLDVKGLQRLDDKNAKRLFKSIPDLTYAFHNSREKAKHSLSEPEEKIIFRKDSTGISTLTELYDLITNDFRFEMKIKVKDKKGKVKIRTKKIENQQQLVGYAHSPKPEEREAAYQALFVPYQKNIDKFFLTYSAICKDWKMEGDLRKYKSPISVRNSANNIPDKAIQTLLKVCSDNIGIYHKYFKVKAKMLKVKKLRRYDIYAPVDVKKEKVSFSEAQQMVFDTYEEFSPSFAEKAKSVIASKHLDSHPRKNKRNGAFCMSIVPSVLPYVLTNFDGKPRDVSTIAHELGHAIHDIYASNHYYSVCHAPLPLCETASTFGEMIVFEKMLAKADTAEKKRALLIEKLGDSYATIIRQNYFIKFEILAHELLYQGCTEKDLSALYLKLLKEQFGNSVIVNEEFRHEWAYIPHIFHTPFYCYAYNFGELLSLALFAKYKKEGKKFIPKLEKILAAGGSQDPVKLLKSVGVNILSASFWQGGFKVIEGWVRELEKV